VLDSYFQPSASLDLAQHLAAEAFRADYTFFITCGTSIANQDAFGALAGTGKRILVDRTAHQSIHIAAGQSSASVDYAPAAEGLSPAGQPLPDIVQLLEMVAAAADAGTPYNTIVLAACSYDGVLYNLHRIMSECLALSPATAFLVDEAWSAINTFHPGLRPLTALDAAHRIAASGTPISSPISAAYRLAPVTGRLSGLVLRDSVPAGCPAAWPRRPGRRGRRGRWRARPVRRPAPPPSPPAGYPQPRAGLVTAWCSSTPRPRSCYANTTGRNCGRG
jgi:hypothetical protein